MHLLIQLSVGSFHHCMNVHGFLLYRLFAFLNIHQILDIALRSFDRGKIESRHRKSRLHGIGADIFDDFYMHARIFDHAFLADILPARLELRLYKADGTAAVF